MADRRPFRRDHDADEWGRVLDAERGRLLLLAYRVCGTWADAEDVVQQAALEWFTSTEPARNPAGWLTRVTVRRAIDVLRTRQHAATYPGPWLPEPLVATQGVGPEESVESRETLTMAFMVLAEMLTPPQRAVLVLRSLDYSHAEIAQILAISPSASRQHHARGVRCLERAGYRVEQPHMAGRAGERPAEQTTRLLEAFLMAAGEGDVERLASLLHADVRAYQDGGGRTRAARRVLVGVGNVARFATGVAMLHRARRTATFVNVNRAPGTILTLSGVAHVVSIEVRDGRISHLFDVCNPDKHTTLDRRGRDAEADVA